MSVLDLQPIVQDMGYAGTYPELVEHQDKKTALVISVYRKQFEQCLDVDTVLYTAQHAMEMRNGLKVLDPTWKVMHQRYLDAMSYADALHYVHARIGHILKKRSGSDQLTAREYAQAVEKGFVGNFSEWVVYMNRGHVTTQ